MYVGSPIEEKQNKTVNNIALLLKRNVKSLGIGYYCYASYSDKEIRHNPQEG